MGAIGAAPGPLLEFVHLCTQGQGLEQRLNGQVRRLRDEVRSGSVRPAELDLLRMAAVAGAYEAGVDASLLVADLDLPDPGRTLEQFEREYLLRRGPDGVVTGLHPIRSAILGGLLCDHTFATWATAASAVVPAVPAGHLERFLLFSLSRRSAEERSRLIASLRGVPCSSWEQAAAIGRSLLWRGLADYVEENRGVIDALRAQHPGFWHLLLNWDVADIGPDTAASILDHIAELSDAFTKARESAAHLARQQTDPARSCALFRQWIEACPHWPARPQGDRDWAGLGDLLFWARHLSLDVAWLDNTDASGWRSLVRAGSLESVASAARGIGLCAPLPPWWSGMQPLLSDRFREETRSPVLLDDGHEVQVKFLVDPTDYRRSNDPHAETMWRIGLLRKLLPDRELYRCQGYGHRLFDEAIDGTTKAIPAGNPPMTHFPNATVRS